MSNKPTYETKDHIKQTVFAKQTVYIKLTIFIIQIVMQNKNYLPNKQSL